MATFRTSRCQDDGKILKCQKLRCQGIKRRFRKPKLTREHNKKDLSKSFESFELKPKFPNFSAWSSRAIINLINMLKTYDCEGYSSLMIINTSVLYYYYKMTISYEQCYADIIVFFAMKWRHLPILLAALFLAALVQEDQEGFFPKQSTAACSPNR